MPWIGKTSTSPSTSLPSGTGTSTTANLLLAMDTVSGNGGDWVRRPAEELLVLRTP